MIETADRFPKKVCFQAWNDKGELITRLKQGDEVKVSFDLESREFNGKWYTDAKVWKMEAINGGSTTAEQSINSKGISEEAPLPMSDDLPF